MGLYIFHKRYEQRHRTGFKVFGLTRCRWGRSAPVRTTSPLKTLGQPVETGLSLPSFLRGFFFLEEAFFLDLLLALLPS